VLASWRGEYLSSFPLYTELEEDDLEAWRAWVDELKQHQFLDDTLAECRRMAEICRGVSGYAIVEGAGEPDENGFIEGNLKLDDDPYAFALLKKAAEQGLASAQNNLGSGHGSRNWSCCSKSHGAGAC
jgi:TPR repeat protein